MLRWLCVVGVSVILTGCTFGSNPYDTLNHQYDTAAKGDVQRINDIVQRYVHGDMTRAEFDNAMAAEESREDGETARLGAAGQRLDAAVMSMPTYSPPPATPSAPSFETVVQPAAPAALDVPPPMPIPDPCSLSSCPHVAPPLDTPAQRLRGCLLANNCQGVGGE